jgi:hypothetical protein
MNPQLKSLAITLSVDPRMDVVRLLAASKAMPLRHRHLVGASLIKATFEPYRRSVAPLEQRMP